MGFENSVKLATADLWFFALWLERAAGDRWLVRPSEPRADRLKRLVRFGLAGCLDSKIVGEFQQWNIERKAAG